MRRLIGLRSTSTANSVKSGVGAHDNRSCLNATYLHRLLHDAITSTVHAVIVIASVHVDVLIVLPFTVVITVVVVVITIGVVVAVTTTVALTIDC